MIYEIFEVLEKSKNNFCHEIDIKIVKEYNIIKIITPILDDSNDHIEVFVKIDNDKLIICDLNIIYDKSYGTNLQEIIKFLNLQYNYKNGIYITRNTNKINNVFFWIINFAKDLSLFQSLNDFQNIKKIN